MTASIVEVTGVGSRSVGLKTSSVVVTSISLNISVVMTAD